MNRRDFHQLLGQVDARYQERPEALARSTDRWARFGMLVLSIWLGLLVALAGLTFALGLLAGPPGGLIAVGLAVALTLYALAQASLFLPVEPTSLDSQLLGPDSAPDLRAMLADLRRDLGCRDFDEIRIALDFNASVSELNRLRWVGRPRIILEVGLPLLLILSQAELKAVLAHEFIHLSARHGRGGARIQRLHRRWAELFARLHQPGAGTLRRGARWAASKFVGWYWPRLQARSLVLSRHHEHQADRVAASVAGPQALISSLWKLQCRGPWLADRFWPDQQLGAVASPEPPADVMDRLRAALRTPPSLDDAARWADRALNRRTALDETHPAFFNRAVALGADANEILGLRFESDDHSESAAALLGTDLDGVMKHQSELWHQAERASWRDRHRRANLEARRLRSGRPKDPLPFLPEIAPIPSAALPEIARLWLAARETSDLRGMATAEPQFRAILDRSPGHPGTSVLLGQHLIGRGESEGEQLLWAVAGADDEQWTPPACRVLEAHYRISGDLDRQRQARDLLDQHEANIEQARAERTAIGAGDPFEPHGLAPEAIEPVRRLLSSRTGCAEGWLARKAVRFFPNRPVFVLAVRSQGGFWNRADRDAALVRDLAARIQLPGQALVVARSGSFRGVARAVEATDGARIFVVEPAAGG